MSKTATQTVTSKPPEEARAWYRGALVVAVVSAVFCLFVSGVLIYQHVRYGMADPMDDARFVALIEQQRAQPTDSALDQRLQTLDLQLRDSYFLHRRRAALGAWLLLGGAVLFLASAKLAASMRRRLPAPQPAPPDPDNGQQVLSRARWAVVALAVVVAGIAVGLIGAPQPKFISDDDPTAAVEPVTLPSWDEYQQHWPRFRGPGGLGIARGDNYPTQWNIATGENVRWNVPLDLPGFNSPVVWGDRVFLGGADKQQNRVWCYHADTGERLWSRPVRLPQIDRAKVEVMEDTGFAAPTLATDGLRVYAIFATGELAAFDFAGNALWSRPMPIGSNAYGYANSLITWRGRVIVQIDGVDKKTDEPRSRLYAIDGATGRDVWVRDRPAEQSWTSPIIVRDEQGGGVIVTVAMPNVIAHDAETGAILWTCGEIGYDSAPSPITGAGLIFAISANEQLLAIRPGGEGDVTETHLAWRDEDSFMPDTASPLCDGQRVYLLETSGIVTCVRVADGKPLYEEELPGPFNASPTLAGETIYLFNKKGRATMIKAADTFEKLAEADFGEKAKVFASPAFVNGRIYVRTDTHLICLEAKEPGTP